MEWGRVGLVVGWAVFIVWLVGRFRVEWVGLGDLVEGGGWEGVRAGCEVRNQKEGRVWVEFRKG